MSTSSSSDLKLKYRIPLEEIMLATDNFSKENFIGDGGFGDVYRGKLSERWKNRTAAIKRLNPQHGQGKHEFYNELKLISSFHHPNIIPFIGYCDQGKEMMIVYDYATNKSLDHHLRDTEKRRHMTWVQRLNICTGAARGLEYLHSSLGPDHRVIHRDFKSANVLLDDNMKAKVSDFGLSKVGLKNQLFSQINTSAVGTHGYCDPVYSKTGDLTKESDIYSFGVVLFEILSGMLVYEKRCIEDKSPRGLNKLIQDYRPDNLDKIIDSHIIKQIGPTSFRTFVEIACKCIQDHVNERPTMDMIIRKLEEAFESQEKHELDFQKLKNKLSESHDYKIPLEEILVATDNFSREKYIGAGLYGKVYKGNLSAQWSNQIVAIRRQDQDRMRGKSEFLNELEKVYNFDHENIITFVGFCVEDGEMITVYKYAINANLNQHIKDTNKMRCITWIQRLKICIGVARGLKYLHFGLGGNRRVIHRDIKSMNILLDDNLEAKITNFGSSKFSPRNQEDTHVSTKFVRSVYYGDPAIIGTSFLIKESDSYGFGVVLFEILCGRPVYPIQRYSDGDDSMSLIKLIERNYKDKDKLYNMIDPHIRDQIESKSLETFKEIAYRCLKLKYTEQPTMNVILGKLEEAFTYQECFSLSTLKGKNCLTISAMELFKENKENILGWESTESTPGSRFLKIAKFKRLRDFTNKMHISTQMLSLETTYAVYIICRDTHEKNSLRMSRRFLLDCYYGSEILLITSVERRDDGWIEMELCHFTNHLNVANFEFRLVWYDANIEDGMFVEGIEFRPIEMDIIKEAETKIEELVELESDTDREQQLPIDYQEIMKRSSDVPHSSTKKELRSLLSTTGIFTDDKSMWFWLSTSNGRTCIMLSPKMLTVRHTRGTEIQDEESRFSLVMAFFKVRSFEIEGKMKAHMLSPKTLYAALLVFKFAPNRYIPLLSREYIATLTLGKQKQKTRRVYLGPSSDMIRPLNDPQSEQGIRVYTMNKRKLDRRAWQRDDGWMEVELFSFFNDVEAHDEVTVGLQINDEYHTAYGFIVQGIEFHPQNMYSMT